MDFGGPDDSSTQQANDQEEEPSLAANLAAGATVIAAGITKVMFRGYRMRRMAGSTVDREPQRNAGVQLWIVSSLFVASGVIWILYTAFKA
jgi:hypothetical protein